MGSGHDPTISRRRFVGGAGAAVLGASLVEIGAAQASSRRGLAATATTAIFQEPDTLDPAALALISTAQVIQSLYDPLIYSVPGRGYFPGLATSFKVSSDGRTYTFKLRRGVRFHDGTPFNAQAVKLNFDRIVDTKFRSGVAQGNLGPYQKTVVVDPYTVQIVFKEPNASFVNEMTHQSYSISSPAAIKKYGKDYGTHPVGTGPFVFKEWIKGQHVTMTRNPNYRWGPSFLKNRGAPQLDQVTFRTLPDHSAQANALQTGEITLAQNLNPQDIAQIMAGGKFTKWVSPAFGIPYAMLLNTTKPPTDDIRVRKALNYAADQDAIIKALYNGVYTPAVSVYDEGTPGFDAKTQDLYPHDPDKAGQLLDDAGWKRGSGGTRQKAGQDLTVKIINISNFGFDNISQLLQAQFKAVGVKMDISEEGFPGVFDTYNKGDQNLANFFYYDVDPYCIHSIFGCAFVANGNLNWAHFCSPAFDKLAAQANRLVNAAQRTHAYDRAAHYLMDQAVLIPIYNKRGVFVGRSSIKGLTFTVNTAPMFNDVTA
jgi:peptide/nickel transport system substrate-binding protein